MHRTSGTQSKLSLLQIWATSTCAMGIVLCAVSSGHAFSVGTLPGLNCDTYVPPVPCQLAPRLSQYEEVHQKITDDALRPVTFTPPSGASVSFSPQALKDIRDGNAGTDYLQGVHELHFDNAYLEQGARHVQAITELLHKDLSSPSTMSTARAKVIRERFGSILHTIQDFYAHSNYVNILPLNSSQQFWDPPAVHTQPPFSNPCDRVLMSFSPLVGNIYDTPLDPLTGHQILTSGYADSLVRGIAPLGQCAHGLLGNGIHKDWTGRDGHDVAKNVAILATTRFTQDIIKYSSNNPNNVCMVMTGKPCGGGVEFHIAGTVTHQDSKRSQTVDLKVTEMIFPSLPTFPSNPWYIKGSMTSTYSQPGKPDEVYLNPSVAIIGPGCPRTNFAGLTCTTPTVISGNVVTSQSSQNNNFITTMDALIVAEIQGDRLVGMIRMVPDQYNVQGGIPSWLVFTGELGGNFNIPISP